MGENKNPITRCGSGRPGALISALSLLLVGSVVFSVVAGVLTATISTRQSYWSVLVLCAIQLAMGIFFQMQSWKLMPIAYHLPFLLLVPATLVGGWVRLK